MTFTLISSKNLKTKEKNPRKIAPYSLKKLSDNIQKDPEFFKMRPCLVKPIDDKNYEIYAGNQRFQAAKKLGWKEIPCIISLANDDIIKDRIILDNIHNGEFDYDILKEDYDPLKLEELGFSLEDLASIFQDITEILPQDEDESELLEIKENPKTALGDIYELNDHKIICGSATDFSCYSNILKDCQIDLIITDPPYNVDYTGKTKDSLKIENDSMDDPAFFDFLLDAYSNMFSVSKEGSCIYVFHADTEGANFRKSFKDSGFKLSQCLSWIKNSLVMGRQDYHWKHEPILYGWKEGRAHKWYSDRTQTTVLEFDRPTRSAEHPTMKPLPLIQYLMKNSSKNGDLVLDPFLGSGTTLIAAEQLGRICYGIELDPKYCDVIVDRYRKYMVKCGKEFTIKLNGILQCLELKNP